ncbi:hypothetical protein [Litorimonas haliclonae]|uniref:hypothetical protein n=1 Tax=Litorimonas haliclonae TaxID=2081977 RepID=UPI0039F0A812
MKVIYLFIASLWLSALTAQADPLEWANGAWGIDVETVPDGLDAAQLDKLRGCDGSAVMINTDRDTMRYQAIHTGEDDLKAKAPILDIGPQWLSLRYDDETRLMKNGDLQIWHMFFVDEDTFYWVLGSGVSEDQREGIIPIARVRCQTLIG